MLSKDHLLTRILFLLSILLGFFSDSRGQATEFPIYEFPPSSIGRPYSGLAFDQKGNLYTSLSDTYPNPGAVIELIPVGNTWNLSTLYAFTGYPYTEPIGVAIDAKGNVYGTTIQGGAYNSGNVFELTPNQGGGWTYSSIHDFNPSGGDGANPYSVLLLDNNGNLYGTAANYGPKGSGVVFELSRTKSGSWKETILHSFPGGTGDGAVLA